MTATRLVDLIAGHPAVYDRIQDLAGRETIMRHMQPWFDRLSGRVLDVGGGTGRISQGLGHGVRYVCVDLERPKLLALKRASAHATGLLADARALPFGSNTFDAALLIGVTHHLSREALPAVAAEIARVLMPSRHLIMLDALWAPKRLVGRALWACDRGHHPRTAADLRAAFRATFEIEDETMFTVLHEYYAVRCRKRSI